MLFYLELMEKCMFEIINIKGVKWREKICSLERIYLKESEI